MHKIYLLSFIICSFLLASCTTVPSSSYQAHAEEPSYKISSSDKNIVVPETSNDKIFIKEYTYRASEDDSKNSSRNKALKQIKILLSEEIGTHIENYLEIKDTVKKGVSHKIIKQEINSLSANITKIKVINESWNGKIYRVKASVSINTDVTMTLLLESIKARSSDKDIKRLNKILAEQKQMIESSNRQLKDANKQLITQEIINEARKSELVNLKEQQVKSNRERQEIDREITAEQKEVERMQAGIAKAKRRVNKSNKKACLLKNAKGMSKEEVIEVLGKPDKGIYGDYYYYGTVSIYFLTSGIYKVNGC